MYDVLTHLSIGSSKFLIYIPYNQETIKIKHKRKFLIDRNTHDPTAFEVTQVDTISHNYDGAITSSKIDNDTISGSKLNNGTITRREIANGAVGNTEIIRSGRAGLDSIYATHAYIDNLYVQKTGTFAGECKWRYNYGGTYKTSTIRQKTSSRAFDT